MAAYQSSLGGYFSAVSGSSKTLGCVAMASGSYDLARWNQNLFSSTGTPRGGILSREVTDAAGPWVFSPGVFAMTVVIVTNTRDRRSAFGRVDESTRRGTAHNFNLGDPGGVVAIYTTEVLCLGRQSAIWSPHPMGETQGLQRSHICTSSRLGPNIWASQAARGDPRPIRRPSSTFPGLPSASVNSGRSLCGSSAGAIPRKDAVGSPWRNVATQNCIENHGAEDKDSRSHGREGTNGCHGWIHSWS